MTFSTPKPAVAPAPVALQVRNLQASRGFFQDLFGLEPGPHQLPGSASVLMVPPAKRGGFAVLLTTEPVRVPLSGLHVELESPNDLLDVYFLALLGGYRTTELRFRRGSLSTVIHDPDGHVIELEAHSPLQQMSLPGRQAWRRTRAVPGREAAGASRHGSAAASPLGCHAQASGAAPGRGG